MENTLAYTPRDFLREICGEEGIGYQTLSQEYIVRLTKGDVSRHALWAHWDCNGAVADRIACDKTACYEVLTVCGVKAVPHVQLLHPLKRMGWTGEKGTWQKALDLFEQYGGRAVLKPNQGTNGRHVYFCDTVQGLESAAHGIFAEYPDLAMSPFLEIQGEYRVFYVYGECPLCYGKTPDPDNWRHNLSQGATAFELNRPGDEGKLALLKDMAGNAARAIGINFATVDVVELASGELMVMEINAGVQAKQLLVQMPHLRPIVKGIYTRAVQGMFES